jgi:hypothetical protein
MTFSATAGFPRTIKNLAAKLQNADGMNKITLYTAGTDGALIKSLFATSTDTFSRTLVLYLNKNGVDYQILQLFVSNLAGAGNIMIDLLKTPYWPAFIYDSEANKCFLLEGGCSIKVAVTSAVTAAKELSVIGCASEY